MHTVLLSPTYPVTVGDENQTVVGESLQGCSAAVLLMTVLMIQQLTPRCSELAKMMTVQLDFASVQCFGSSGLPLATVPIQTKFIFNTNTLTTW